MIRTRSQRVAGLRAGLVAALYAFTALMPASAAAADPSEPAPSESAVVAVEPSAMPAAPIESPVVELLTVEPSPPPEPIAEPSPAEAPPPAPSPSTAPSAAIGYIVTFARGATAQQRTDALSAGDATLISTVPALGLAFVELPASGAAAGAAALRARVGVARVELDRARAIEAVAADPRYAEQWSLRTIGWPSVSVPAGGRSIVAILDTGVDASHPDLVGRLVDGASFVGTDELTDGNGHGTWMAGIVAAATDNSVGIAGIGSVGVKVMPVAALAADGTGQDSDIIRGILYASDNGADVILLAFSAPGYSAALQAAIDYAWDRGAVVVAATGNAGAATPTYPAGDRRVMGVASTDEADRIATDSNHGPTTFLAAPGVRILTTAAGADRDPLTDDEYRFVSGTSAAAAEVAGAAAVLRALDAAASNAVIVGRLARSAAAVGTRDETGNGRLDLGRAAIDTGTDEVVPTGVAGAADGGPFVGPYVAASSTNISTQGTTGTEPATAAQSAAKVSLLTFRMTATAADTFKSVKVQYTGTSTADIANMYLYQENSTIPGAFAGTETLKATATLVGSEYTLDPVDFAMGAGTALQFYIVVDVAAGATLGDAIDVKILQDNITLTTSATPTWPSAADLSVSLPPVAYSWDPAGSTLVASAASLGIFSTQADIGAVGFVGSNNASSGTYTVKGSGADIWDATQQLRLVYTTMVGDGRITARVATLANTHQGAKAGVMIRETIASNSRYALMGITNNGIEFIGRNSNLGANFFYQTSGNGAGVPPSPPPTLGVPIWVRLTRLGTNFTAEYSANGTTWTQTGTTQNLSAMGTTASFGLFVVSHDNTTLITSTFDNVSLTTDFIAPRPTFTTPPASPAVSEQNSTTLSVAWTETEAGSGMASRSLQRQSKTPTTLSTCAGGTYADDGSAYTGASPSAETGMTIGLCYRWALTLTDVAGNATTRTSNQRAVIDLGVFSNAHDQGHIGFATKVANPATLPTGAVTGLAYSPEGDHLLVGNGTLAPRVAIYPWSGTALGTKLADPATLPASQVNDIEFSPDGNYVAFAIAATPFIEVYAWTGSTLGAKQPNPLTLPGFSGVGGKTVTWSPDGGYVVVGGAGGALVYGYAWTDVGFGSLVAVPAAAPAGTVNGAAFSPDGTALAVAVGTTPYVNTYAWNAGFGAKATAAATAPTGIAEDVAWSPDGLSLAVAHATSPFITVYPWSAGAYGLKVANPSPLPAGAGSGVAFDRSGNFIAISHTTTPFVTAWLWTGTFGQVLPNPTPTLPAGNGQELAIDPTGAVAVGHATSPFVTAYETLPGGTTLSAGTYTVKGLGFDIWWTEDQFHYVYIPITGNAQLTARVATMGSTGGNAKAGINFRESLTSNSPNALVTMLAINGAQFGYRTVAGGGTTTPTTTPAVAAPYWVRLTRIGDLFTGEISVNGTTWVPFTAQTIVMGSTIYAGLVVSSTNDASVLTATFDNASFDTTAPAISAFTPSANAYQSGTSVTPTWTETEAGSGVASRSLQRRTGAPSPAASCASTTWANDGAAVNVASGVASTGLASGSCYQWTLTVTDNVGNTSGTSTSSWILVDSSAPTQPSVTGTGTNVYQSAANNPVYFKGGATGTIALSSTSTDAQSGINKHNYSVLSVPANWTYTAGDVAGDPAAKNATWTATAATTNVTLTPYNNALTAGTTRVVALTSDAIAPTMSYSIPAAGLTLQSATSVNVTWVETETGSGVATRSLQRQTGSFVTPGTCAGVTYTNDVAADTGASPRNNTGLLGGRCYRWQLVVTDNVGNVSSTTTSGEVLIGGAPTAVADAYTTNEDTTLNVPVTGSPYNGVLFNDSDPDSDPLTAVLVTDVATGILSLASNGSFSYVPVPDASGVVTFIYKANDGLQDSNTVMVSITVTAVNDAPVVTATVANLAYTENATTVLDAGLTATDVDSANLASATITMTTNYQNGQDVLAFVTQNGITGTWTAATGVLALSGSSTVANYQTALRSITYTNASDAPNTANRTVTFVVNDGAGNSNTASRQIAITAVNDAPLNVAPGAQTLVMNHRLTFASASGNRISMSDVDAAANPVQIQLTVTNGTVTVPSTTGLTFTVGDGTTDPTMTFSGTITNVNNTLAWIIYDPTTNFAGSASIQIVTSDQGNTGSGGTLTDTDSVALSVRNLGIFTANLDVVTPSVRVAPAALPVGIGPYGVEVNPTTNRIYVASFNAGTVSVINGATDGVIATVPVGVGPMGLAVNSVTNRIYVPNNGATKNGTTISVIDGATNAVISTITVAAGPRYVAINEATNTIYVTHSGVATVTIINGATNAVTGTIAVPAVTSGIAVNPVTNRLYVSYGANPGQLRVYNSATSALITTITTGQTPWAVAVNANTNAVYVSNFASNTVSVIDGATNTVTASVTTANWPTGLKLDPNSNRVYVDEFLSDSVAVIDGATSTVVAHLSTGAASNGPTDLGVNPATGRIYVCSYQFSYLTVFQDGLSIAGTSSFTSPTYTVAGSGTGMTSTSDQLQYIYKAMTGDGRLTVRTASITNTAANASAGVMFRDGLAANALFVSSSNTGAGSNNVRQTYRATLGAVPTTVTVAGAAVPQYLRVTRVGNVFTTEYSANGTSWTQAGTPQTIVMSATIYVGLAVTSETAAALNTSTLDTLSLNLAPVAVADPSYTVNEDGTLTQAALGGVLSNDNDPEFGSLTAILVAGTSGLTLSSDGSFSYASPANFNGVATFTYKANDGALDSNTVTATITVAAVNDVPSFTKGANQVVLEDATAQSIGSWATALSRGPADESSQVLDFIVSNDNNSLFTIQPAVSAAGTLSYTPASNANGLATITVRIHDNGGTANGGFDTSAAQTFSITVTAVNDVPSFTKGADQVVRQEAAAQSVSGWATAISPGPANETGEAVDFIVTNDFNGLFSVQPAVTATGTLTYTPAAGVAGIAAVSVRIHDNGTTANGGVDTSAAQTFLITVGDGAYTSSSGWPMSFDVNRYLKLTFPAYVPAGSVVTSATFRHEYRSATAGDTTCYFFEVWQGGTLLATHGSAGSPVSCNAASSYRSDSILLPEVDTVPEANSVTIRLFVWNSGGRSSHHRTATLGVVSSLD
jgi:YVTN family beta-propeller protein